MLDLSQKQILTALVVVAVVVVLLGLYRRGRVADGFSGEDLNHYGRKEAARHQPYLSHKVGEEKMEGGKEPSRLQPSL